MKKRIKKTPKKTAELSQNGIHKVPVNV